MITSGFYILTESGIWNAVSRYAGCHVIMLRISGCPATTFWLVDAQLDSARVLFNVFDADGRPKGKQITADADVVKFCAEAFAAVWERAVYPAAEIFG